MRNTIKILAILMLFVSTTFAQTEWAFDKSHSKVGFSVTHLVITDVEGTFKNYEGSVVTKDDSFDNAEISFTVDVNSIDTDNEKRDNHLRSDDFFNAEKYPEMKFKSREFNKIEGKNWELIGDLTIRDVTREVNLDVVMNGPITDPWGNTRTGFKLTGDVNRFDYNLNWNKVMEAGGLVVGETVTINANVELIKQTDVSNN